jgi:hypothetical protein
MLLPCQQRGSSAGKEQRARKCDLLDALADVWPSPPQACTMDDARRPHAAQATCQRAGEPTLVTSISTAGHESLTPLSLS